MITVHHLNHSRSQRLLWLLEELGLPYEVVRYERDPATMRAPAALRAVHPLGKSPVLVDGDLTLAESGAIVEYLLECYGGGRLAPAPGTSERRRYTFWLHYAEGSPLPWLLMKLVFDRIERAPRPFYVKPFARAIMRKARSEVVLPQIAPHLAYMNAELDGRDWFAGDEFSAADVMLSYPLQCAAARVDLTPYPRLTAFLDRIHARAAWQRALDRGGPYAALR